MYIGTTNLTVKVKIIMHECSLCGESVAVAVFEELVTEDQLDELVGNDVVCPACCKAWGWQAPVFVSWPEIEPLFNAAH